VGELIPRLFAAGPLRAAGITRYEPRILLYIIYIMRHVDGGRESVGSSAVRFGLSAKR